MAVDVQDRGKLAIELFRFIENRDGCKAGDDLITKLAQTVSLTGFHHSEVFELACGIDPLIGPAVKHDIAQQMSTEALDLFRPLRRAGSRRRRSGSAQNVGLHLMQGHFGRKDLFPENGLEVTRITLAEGIARGQRLNEQWKPEYRQTAE